ncbi:hypothetical protein [Filimonas lacunae]|nr:hypothetical protein [Filimonas lacunae]BAV07962.1 hypothetical protein FLA_3994 [Filimonas lacunae]
MKFVIKPYEGALPVKFGMNQEQLIALFPEVATMDIPGFGVASIMVQQKLKISFIKGVVTELEFYVGRNDANTGALVEPTEGLSLELDFAGLSSDLFTGNNALEQLTPAYPARYLPGIWIYPELGLSLCGYDKSPDYEYRVVNLFDKSVLQLQLMDTREEPAQTDLRRTLPVD